MRRIVYDGADYSITQVLTAEQSQVTSPLCEDDAGSAGGRIARATHEYFRIGAARVLSFRGKCGDESTRDRESAAFRTRVVC
jgi:hypothetical protein